MTNEAHVRIDEGIKRGPKKRHPPQAARTGMFMPTVSPERRQEVIEAAIKGIVQGQSTDAIGEVYGIPGRTIRYWLLNDERAEQARKALVDMELSRCGEEIRTATEPLPLARAREDARYWMWIAERRDSQRYGQKQEVTHNITGLSDALASISQARLAATQQSNNVIDLQPDAVQHIDQSTDKQVKE